MPAEKDDLLDLFQRESESGARELARANPFPSNVVGLGNIRSDDAYPLRNLPEKLLHLGRVFGENEASAPFHEVLYGDVLVGVPLDEDLFGAGIYRKRSLGHLCHRDAQPGVNSFGVKASIQGT